MASNIRKHDWSLRPQTWLDESGSPDKIQTGHRICNPITKTRGCLYSIQPHTWLDLIGRPTSYTFIINRILTLHPPTSFSFLHRQCSRDTLPGYGTTETKVQTCSRAPFNRFLFRLSPCVNLFYCLLLFQSSHGFHTHRGYCCYWHFTTTDNRTYLETQGS